MAETTLSKNGTVWGTNHTMYLPWSWTIISTDMSAHSCPSSSNILATFALVNLFSSILTLLFGNRNFVYYITRKRFGKPDAKEHWRWNWIFNVALNLIANLLIAGIIKSSVGYKADFSVWELMLFLLARPRLAWIVMAFMSDKWGETVSVHPTKEAALMQQMAAMGLGGQNTAYKPLMTSDTHALHTMPPSTTTLNSSIWATEVHDDPIHGPMTVDVERRWDLPYYNAFLSAFIAETILQLAALYVMGITVKFAWQKGYYNVGFNRAVYKSVPHDAHLMYAGALYYLIAGSLSLVITMLCLCLQFLAPDGDHKKPIGLQIIQFIAVFFLLATTFLGSWLFWAGFVKLAGQYYYPPKIVSHAAIWTLASMFGAFFGAGA